MFLSQCWFRQLFLSPHRIITKTRWLQTVSTMAGRLQVTVVDDRHGDGRDGGRVCASVLVYLVQLGTTQQKLCGRRPDMVSGRMATAHTWRKTRARLHRVRLRKCHYSGAQRRSLAVWLWFGGQMGARLDALFSWARALFRMRVHPMTGQRSRLRFMSPGKIIPGDEIVEICSFAANILWVFAAISTSKAESVNE
jgi:hypothetical protein